MPVVTSEEEGLRSVHDPENATIDIILIHGLQGHPRETWLHRSEIVSQSRFSGLFKRKNVTATSDDTCYWPKDLLAQDFPNARIMTYGYDSRVSNFFNGPTEQTGIRGHGNSLLTAIESSRPATERPIVFIAHSLGGLILKDALRRSFLSQQEYNKYLRCVYDNTRATLFLGTPHRGSGYADWGLIARHIACAVGFDASQSIVRDLRVDSVTLDSLTEEFAVLLREGHFIVYSLLESKGLKGVAALNQKVVPDVSAVLGDARERRDFINGNHMDMCRFKNQEDNGYRKVKEAINKSLQLKAARSLYDKRQMVLNLLKLEQTFWRYQQIEKPTQKSFSWLFGDEALAFEHWLQRGTGLFWIKGKPASGKSTLMKMIYDHLKTRKIIRENSNQQVSAAFFFHDRGSENQKSFFGLLCSILFQILDSVADLTECVLSAFPASLFDGEEILWSSKVTLKVLQSAFQLLVNQQVRKINIYLFLDALDEYSGDHTEIATFLRAACTSSVASLTQVKICFSSRPLNAFMDFFHNCPGFYMESHTTGDIELVIDTIMKQDARMSQLVQDGNKDVLNLRRQILQRAQGVFLWVRLVLQELLQDFSDGAGIPQLTQLLDEIPDDLSALYLRIWERIPQKYKDEALIMLDIVRFAPRPLPSGAFYDIFHNAGSDDLSQFRFGELTPRSLTDLERILRSRTGGLLELSKVSGFKNNLQVVQFIHQTVKSFAAENTMRSRLSQTLASQTSGFEYFLKTCLAAIEMVTVRCKNHASIPSESLIGYYDLQNGWIAGLTIDFVAHVYAIEKVIGECCPALWDLFSENALDKLHKSLIELFGMERTPHLNALEFAVATGLYNSVKELLIRRKLAHDEAETLLSVAFDFAIAFYKVRCDVELPDLTCYASIITLILQKSPSGPLHREQYQAFNDMWFRRWTEAFMEECSEICASASDAFLAMGQDPNVVISYFDYTDKRNDDPKKKRFTSPLHIAADVADFDSVKVMIDCGAYTSSLDSEQCTPLDRVYWSIMREVQPSDGVGSSGITMRDNRDMPARIRTINYLLSAGAMISAQGECLREILSKTNKKSREIPATFVNVHKNFFNPPQLDPTASHSLPVSRPRSPPMVPHRTKCRGLYRRSSSYIHGDCVRRETLHLSPSYFMCSKTCRHKALNL